MTITAKIIADTVWPDPNTGTRITTMQLRYPRFIHAEFMTHRAFSRNASSSRAIPVERLIQDVIDDMAMPIYWGKNQKGMQAKEELTGEAKEDAIVRWEGAARWAISSARNLAHGGAHKQIVNRVLEPFSHINVVVTATEWTNFFELRDHPDAQPEIQELARVMKKAMAESEPEVADKHIPYVMGNEDISIANMLTREAIKVSAARCARVSYLTFEGNKSRWLEDLALCDKLAGSEPIHFSPFEHQARWMGNGKWGADGTKYANFTDWRSQRWCMERELSF